MTTITLGVADPIGPLEPTVEVTDSLSNGWYSAPYLICHSLQLFTGNRDSVAILTELAGEIKPAGGKYYQPYFPHDRPLHFVRVTVPFHDGSTSYKWVGIIVQQTNSRAGEDNGNILIDQSYVAYGIEWMLHRELITKSLASIPVVVGGVVSTYQYSEIGRAIPFNGGTGRSGGSDDLSFANRSVATDFNGVYRFSEDPLRSSSWTAHNIIAYLQKYFQPDLLGGFKWTLGADLDDYLDWQVPRGFEIHGKSLREIINELVDTKRGLTHYWEWYDLGRELVLNVQSQSTATLSLPGGKSLAPNSSIIAVDASTGQRDAIVLMHDYSSRWDQVVVESDYITSTFGVGLQSGSLVNDFGETEIEAYDNAAKAVSGYADKDTDAKELLNDLFRVNNPVARRAFTRFRIPEGWTGFNTANNTVAFPVFKVDGSIVYDLLTHVGPYYSYQWTNGLKLSLRTRIPSWLDYTNPATPVVRSSVLVNGENDENLVFIKVDTKVRGVVETRYCKLSDLSALAKTENAGNNGITFAVHAKAYDSGPGLIIEPTGPANVIAKARNASLMEPTAPDNKGVLDYETIVAAVTVELDQRARAVYPFAPTPTRGQIARQVINLQGHARRDYIAKGTPLGTDASGQLVLTTSGGMLRDDFSWMLAIAQSAYEWYRIERHAIRFGVPYLLGSIFPADLISVIDELNINTLVSAITYDFEKQSTTIETAGAEEIDFLRFLKS